MKTISRLAIFLAAVVLCTLLYRGCASGRLDVTPDAAREIDRAKRR